MEQIDRRSEQGEGVGDALADEIGRVAVDGLVDPDVIADVDAEARRDPPGEPIAETGQYVPVEVAHEQHVELVGVQHELHARGVDDHRPQRDIRILGRHLLDGL